MEASLSPFTRSLLTSLKSQFDSSSSLSLSSCCRLFGLSREQEKHVETNCRTKKEAILLSLQMIRSSSSSSSASSIEGSLSDECYVFTHIVDCVKSLMEISEAKNSSSRRNDQRNQEKEREDDRKKKENPSHFLYSGFLSCIEKVVKEVIIPSSELFKVNKNSSSTASSSINDDLNRCCVTIHSVSSFPLLTSPSTDASKKLPLLHFAAFNAKAVELVRIMYNSNPESIRCKDKTGALPLHWAILNNQAPEIATYLLEMYPEGASCPDSAGYLPLHWAVNTDDTNLTIIKQLLHHFPQAARTPASKNKTLPLHWCVNRSEPNLSLVKELLISYPEAVSTPCDNGWLPLHYCVNRAKVSLTILRLLLDKYPAGVSHRNSDGQMPIHRLLDRYEPNRKAVKWLIEAEPATLKSCDSEGYLPLHVALDGDKPPSWRLVKLLLQAAPQSVQVTTLDGFLPLHVVMKMQDRFGDPDAKSLPSSNQEKTEEPSVEQEAALKLNQNRYLSIVQELVTLYPEAVHVTAVDIVPIKDGVDAHAWEGPWRKSRWTPYSRAVSKGKHTPIAKLLRPYRKKDNKDVVSEKKPMSSPGKFSTPTPGATSSGHSNSNNASSLNAPNTTKAIANTPIAFNHHRSPVEIQLQNQLHAKSSRVDDYDNQNPSSSNHYGSKNYGHLDGFQLPSLNAANQSNHATSKEGNNAHNLSNSPRSKIAIHQNSQTNKNSNSIGGHLANVVGNVSGQSSSPKTLKKSEHAELFGSLDALRGKKPVPKADDFWSEKQIEVKDGPKPVGHFTIDNDADVTKSWKWQW